jgi:hypothetical protein
LRPDRRELASFSDEEWKMYLGAALSALERGKRRALEILPRLEQQQRREKTEE